MAEKSNLCSLLFLFRLIFP